MGRGVRWVLRHQVLTLLVTAATFALTLYLYIIVPKGFFPVQDTGVLLAITEAPQSISFGAMAERQQEVANIILKDPDVESLSSFIGIDAPELDAERGADSDQPEGRETSEVRRRSTSFGGCSRRWRRSTGCRRFLAASTGFDGRRPGEPDAVSVLG